jgi:hypothetical protein
VGTSVKGLGFRVDRAVVEAYHQIAIILLKDLRRRVEGYGLMTLRMRTRPPGCRCPAQVHQAH